MAVGQAAPGSNGQVTEFIELFSNLLAGAETNAFNDTSLQLAGEGLPGNQILPFGGELLPRNIIAAELPADLNSIPNGPRNTVVTDMLKQYSLTDKRELLEQLKAGNISDKIAGSVSVSEISDKSLASPDDFLPDVRIVNGHRSHTGNVTFSQSNADLSIDEILTDKNLSDLVTKNLSDGMKSADQLNNINRAFPADARNDVSMNQALYSHITAGNPGKNEMPVITPKIIDITVPFDKPEWAKEFSNQVRWITENNLQSAELRLHPRNLGSIEVKINVHNDQTNVHFLTPNAAVRDTLEASMVRLRDMLGDSGLSLGNFDVSDQSSAETFARDSGSNGQLQEEFLFAIDHVEEPGDSVQEQLSNIGIVDFYA